jgi:hypothetical protein
LAVVVKQELSTGELFSFFSTSFSMSREEIIQ